MNHFAIEYPNHTTLLVKSVYGLKEVAFRLSQSRGIFYVGVIYNPKAFLVLRAIHNPDERQQLRSLSLNDILIGE